jgi:hypothetical protein
MSLFSFGGVCGCSLAGIAGSNPARGMDVCILCVLSGRGLCDGPVTRPEESYRVWCVFGLEISTIRSPSPTRDGRAMGKQYFFLL